jgi:hypothetical protein
VGGRGSPEGADQIPLSPQLLRTQGLGTRHPGRLSREHPLTRRTSPNPEVNTGAIAWLGASIIHLDASGAWWRAISSRCLPHLRRGLLWCRHFSRFYQHLWWPRREHSQVTHTHDRGAAKGRFGVVTGRAAGLRTIGVTKVRLLSPKHSPSM